MRRSDVCTGRHIDTVLVFPPPPPPELHIRVPFFSQRLLHKHSADKNLQDEVRAGRVGPLLLRRPGDHQLYGVSLLTNPP